eukprot:7294375-Pyramimonas_sp.AAC.1
MSETDARDEAVVSACQWGVPQQCRREGGERWNDGAGLRPAFPSARTPGRARRAHAREPGQLVGIREVSRISEYVQGGLRRN